MIAEYYNGVNRIEYINLKNKELENPYTFWGLSDYINYKLNTMETAKQQLEALTGETNNNNNKTIVKRTPVAGSSYIHVETEQGHFLTLRNYRVTDIYETEDQLKQYMEESWMELMTRTMVVMNAICKKMDAELGEWQTEIHKNVDK